MKFTEKLLKEAMPIWEKYLDHPFIKEIGEGTLDKNKFREYLVQDYLYLKEYAKVFCAGVVKAKTMEEMKFFYKSTKGTMEDETAVHIEYLKGFGISELDAEKREYKSTTISYTSYMQAIALTGDLDEIAIATLPCTWSYSYIGKYISKKYSNKLQGNFFKSWIDEYASDGFDIKPHSKRIDVFLLSLNTWKFASLIFLSFAFVEFIILLCIALASFLFLSPR